MANTELFFDMLSSPGEMIQQLLSPDPLEREPAAKWVEHHDRITRQFATLSEAKERKRMMARRRYWNENIGIYRQALTDVFGLYDFPMLSDRELRSILSMGQMTSLLNELFVQRFIDRKAKWHRNDLIDIMYLSCAAGYCDYVVAENRTGTQLQQLQRSQRKPPNVFTSLQALVQTLHARRVTTDSERRAQAATDLN